MIYAVVTLNPRRKFGETWSTPEIAQADARNHYNEHNWTVKGFTDHNALHQWLRGVHPDTPPVATYGAGSQALDLLQTLVDRGALCETRMYDEQARAILRAAGRL